MNGSCESQTRFATQVLPQLVDDEVVCRLGVDLRQLAKKGPYSLCIDARRVVDIDSRGLAMLLAVQQIGEARGTRVVILASPGFVGLVQRLGLANRLTLTEAAEDAE